ncbi:MAG: demethoxyubiquinone hydroxylase family protein [Robiginitomaculum sp.]|nr:demethoxyubiquinone hydroxylase family protein [Robiginitomaculum sp.]
MTRPAPPGGKPKRTASPRIKEMLRVDHAGEYAAVAIYDAQAKVFGRSRKTQKIAKQLAHMRDEEQEHLDAFNALLLENNARPTALIGLWKIASTGLGIGTALMGEKAAHACTEAVESVIEKHYAEQIEETKDSDPELCATFTKFREDELRHHDHAVEQGAKEAPGYPLLSAVIKAGCRTAIRLSEKI